MIVKKALSGPIFAVLITCLCCFTRVSSSQAIQDSSGHIKSGPPILWHDPGEVEKLDFVGGVGGRDQAPKPPFTFEEEILSGTNPKVRVKDAGGTKWAVKFGTEARAEVFSTRMAWAAGYFVEPSY